MLPVTSDIVGVDISLNIWVYFFVVILSLMYIYIFQVSMDVHFMQQPWDFQ